MRLHIHTALVAAVGTIVFLAMTARADPVDPPKPDARPPIDAATLSQIKKDAGFGAPNAMFDLATLYEQSVVDGVVNFPEAFALYDKAAEKGDRRSRERLCLAYLLGEGRPADSAKAMGFCNKLPDDNAAALYSAGYDYDHGISGPKDEKAAIGFYAQAIKKGSGEAMDAIGMKALAANNPTGARKWFRQGVVNGSGDAMAHLASLIDLGQGGASDKDEAHWLYINAAQRDNKDARDWLANHPSGPSLRHTSLVTAKTSLITEIITGKDGKATTKPLDVMALGKDLTKYFPAQAMAEQVSGTAIVECYIDGDHQIDVCLSKFEYPVGYGYGPIILALFNGQFKVTEMDAQGKPTAHTTTSFQFNWLLK